MSLPNGDVEPQNPNLRISRKKLLELPRLQVGSHLFHTDDNFLVFSSTGQKLFHHMQPLGVTWDFSGCPHLLWETNCLFISFNKHIY